MQIFTTPKRFLLVLTLATGLLAGSFDERRAEAFPDPDENAAIKKIVDAALRPVVTGQPGFTGIVVGVRRNGHDFFYYYGDLKNKGNGTLPKLNTLFMIGSVTKTFTATQLALYSQQGHVSMDQQFQKNIPTAYHVPLADPKSKITLEQLATHSSGLKRDSCAKPKGDAKSDSDDGFGLSEDAAFDPQLSQCAALGPAFYKGRYEDTQAYAEYRCQNGNKDCQLISSPGNKHTYSNFAYGLLGLCLANAASPANSTWDFLVRRDITAPLGMPDTGIRNQLNRLQLARRATGHEPTGLAVSDLDTELPTFPTLAAGGGLWSTPDDLMRWMTFTMGEYPSSLSPLLPTILKKRHTFQSDYHLINQPGQQDSMALGWEYSPLNPDDAKSQSSTEVVWKGGGSPGFNAFVGFIPKKKTGVLIMANFKFTGSYRIGHLAFSILRALDKE